MPMQGHLLHLHDFIAYDHHLYVEGTLMVLVVALLIKH